jgi:hypothetical protein
LLGTPPLSDVQVGMEKFQSVELSPEFVQGFRTKIISGHPLRNLGDELNGSLPPLLGCRGYRGRIADAEEVPLKSITKSLYVQICQSVIQPSSTKECVRVSIKTVEIAKFLANS